MILLTGGNGFLGKAVQAVLMREGMQYEVIPRGSYWEADRYDASGVIHMAGLCGGIQENMKRPADFIRDNIQVGINALEMTREYHIPRFLNVSSACAYPERIQNHAFMEWQMHEGRPQETHASYGIGKRAVMEMTEAYAKQYGIDGFSVVLANLYGVGVEYNAERAHVIPALVEKMWMAKKENLRLVKVLGTGKARREFLYVEDAARAIVKLYKDYDRKKDERVKEARGVINVGSGDIRSIKEVAETVKELAGYGGRLEWDESYPDGNAVREVNSEYVRGLGWGPEVGLKEGIRRVVEDFVGQVLVQ